MRSKSGRQNTGAQRARTGARLALACAVLVLLGLLAPLALGDTGVARGSTLADVDATPGAALPPSKAQSTSTPQPTRPTASWERTVLRALADAMTWPTDVNEGPGGKLSVELEMSADEWYQASIRPFETDAGAGAAFRPRPMLLANADLAAA